MLLRVNYFWQLVLAWCLGSARKSSFAYHFSEVFYFIGDSFGCFSSGEGGAERIENEYKNEDHIGKEKRYTGGLLSSYPYLAVRFIRLVESESREGGGIEAETPPFVNISDQSSISFEMIGSRCPKIHPVIDGQKVISHRDRDKG